MALPWVRALRWPKGVCPAGEVVLLAALPRVTCHHGCTDARLCRWRFGLRGFDAKIESGLLPKFGGRFAMFTFAAMDRGLLCCHISFRIDTVRACAILCVEPYLKPLRGALRQAYDSFAFNAAALPSSQGSGVQVMSLFGSMLVAAAAMLCVPPGPPAHLMTAHTLYLRVCSCADAKIQRLPTTLHPRRRSAAATALATVCVCPHFRFRF